MDSLIHKTAQAIGAPDDLLRIAFCIVGSFPLSSLVKRIPPRHALLKDLAVSSIGIFFLVGVFNLFKGTLLLLALAGVTYTLIALFPGKKWMPWLNFAVQMGLMLVTHCREQFGGGDFVNDIGISGSQMIVVQKLTSFAWDVYDSTRPEGDLTSHQKASKVDGKPSIFRYIAWIFFFPTVLTGPSCTYTEYSNWADLSMFKSMPGTAQGPAPALPRSGFLILGLKIVEGLFWICLYTQSTSINYDFVYTSWYHQVPLWGRMGYIYLVGLMYRTKYYAAWTLTEASCIHCGIGYNDVNPQTGRLKWDRMRNVKPLSVESGQNMHDILANWNIITSKWLRYYVYERVTPKNTKPGVKSTFITFLVSALWHGTRPGYYLTFITAAMYQTFGKLYRRQLRPVFLNTRYKKVYDVITWIISQLALGYAVLPFIVLDLKPAFWSWYSVYFYIHVGLLVSWILLQGPGRALVLSKPRMMHRDIKKAE